MFSAAEAARLEASGCRNKNSHCWKRKSLTLWLFTWVLALLVSASFLTSLSATRTGSSVQTQVTENTDPDRKPNLCNLFSKIHWAAGKFLSNLAAPNHQRRCKPSSTDKLEVSFTTKLMHKYDFVCYGRKHVCSNLYCRCCSTLLFGNMHELCFWYVYFNFEVNFQ